MTLSESLLERIAEDERDIRDSRIGDDPAWWMPTWLTSDWLLADCAAKRLIVGLHAAPQTCDGVHPGQDTYHPDGHGPDATLLALAMPYADHPDFQQEWQ